MKKYIISLFILFCGSFYISAQNCNNIYPWKINGDKEYATFKSLKERVEFLIETDKTDSMYETLMNAYLNYIQSDELFETGKNDSSIDYPCIKEIEKNLLDMHPSFIHAGMEYNNNQDYQKAIQYFEAYTSYADLKIFPDFVKDSIYATIQYYTIVIAIQSENSPKTIELLKTIINQPYIPNSTYKESDPYELLAYEYQQRDDKENFIRILKLGIDKFPNNYYFTGSLINELIIMEDYNLAFKYLDFAIKQYPDNSQLVIAKASIYTLIRKYNDAIKVYEKIIKKDPNNKRGLEGLGVVYVLIAQDAKEIEFNAKSKKEKKKKEKEAINNYKKSLPYFYKLLKLSENDENSNDFKRPTLFKLQNVLYHLNLLNVDKKSEYDKVEQELDKLKN